MTVLVERPAATRPLLRSIALEITGACQASCAHCYNHSGPQGTAGAMTREHWCSVNDQAATVGVQRLQFIAGEPSLHPDLGTLVEHALTYGMSVEVFTNLIHVRPHLWPIYERQGVNLATSYYSDQAAEHEKITRHRGSYARTKANIAEAVRRGIGIRAAIVDVLDGQRVLQAIAELQDLGVKQIRVDRLRHLGRGAEGNGDGHDPAQLCGQCTRGRAAVLPTGDVSGCVMSRWMTAGNVLTSPLAEIVDSPEWQQIAAVVPAPRRGADCNPEGSPCGPDQDSCEPIAPYRVTACNPDSDGSDCAPAETEACGPAYGE